MKLKLTKKKHKLRLNQDWVFGNQSYKKGELFDVIGSDPIRGDDIQDSQGNKIFETRFIADKFDDVLV